MPEKQRRPQARGPAGGVEGVYREVALACQTVNASVLGIFCRAEKGHKLKAVILLSRIDRGPKLIAAFIFPSRRHKAHAPEGFPC
jgi:hypothetical protein